MLVNTAPTHELGFVFGRFDPPHLPHKALALELKKKVKRLAIGLGSYRCAPNIINPFPAILRKEMWQAMLPDEELLFFEVHDTLYNEAQWDLNFECSLMKILRHQGGNIDFGDIACIGHKKKGDKSTFYLDKFKSKFKYYPYKTKSEINATDIRFGLFGNGYYQSEKGKIHWTHDLDPKVVDWLVSRFLPTDAFIHLQEEQKKVQDYKEKHQGQVKRFGVTAMTGDAIVTYGASVLVGYRKGFPGKGQIAFPGGFVNPNENTVDAMLRELTEETSITLRKDQLKFLIKNQRVFGNPRRDPRGRIYSHGFHIRLDDTLPCPYPIGGSDLKNPFFMPIREFYENSHQVAFDHVQMLDWFIHGGDDY